MIINQDFFEKHFKKNDKITAYSPENIPLKIYKEYHIKKDGSVPGLTFSMDCADLALYCEHMALSFKPHNND